MKNNKYTKKIESIKKKRYNYSSEEKLKKQLSIAGGSDDLITKGEIDELINCLKHRESIGEIKGLVIRDLKKHLYIMWDDDSLGEPIIIKKGW
jgi:hypothetical protein